jgi:hypothetical protein
MDYLRLQSIVKFDFLSNQGVVKVMSTHCQYCIRYSLVRTSENKLSSKDNKHHEVSCKL